MMLANPFEANASLCGCNAYFTVTAKPSWVGRETLNKQHYITHGSANCTGLKKQDVAQADKSALANLTRMIGSQVQSTQSIKQADFGLGVTLDSFKENTSIISDLSLSNTHVFDHWLDRKNCTVYAAIKMNTVDVAKTLLTHKNQQKNKWLNQTFFIKAGADTTVTTRLNNILSALSIVTTANRSKSNLIITPSVKSLSKPSKTLAQLTLTIDIKARNGGPQLWRATTQGKGFSYQAKNKDTLHRLAISDALERITADLVDALISRSMQ